MIKPHRICALLLLLLTLTAAEQPRRLQATSPAITASRSPQLNTLCTNANRASLYSQFGLSGSVAYTTDFSRFFSLDRSIFDSFLNLDVGSINSQLQSNTLGYATYVAPAFVGPALLLLIGPLLAVCLCCPCRCCQRKKLLYSSCEKTWPALIAMVLAAALLATCCIGLTSNFKIYNGYQDLSCSGVIGVDDALYGGVSYDGKSFFAGVSTINTQLQSLTSGNLNYILGNLTAVSSSGSSTGSALNLMSSALGKVSAIPDPSGGSLSLNYNTPLSSATPTATISSTFPSLLGTSLTNSSLVGKAYASLSAANSNLSSITSTVDSFKSQSGGFTSSVNQMINDTTKSISLLRSTLLTIKDVFVTQDYFSRVYYIELVFYGAILGMTALYLLALTAFACCGRMSCRHMLHLCGFLLFLVALLTSALFLLLTFSSAIFYSGCSYMAATIADPDAFVSNLDRLGIDSTVAGQYSVCLAGQGGDILGKLSGAQNRNYLTTLQYVMQNVTSFNGAALSSSLTAAYTPLTRTLGDYAAANTLDILDSAALQELKFIANPSNFNCASGNFKFDSWLPSIHQTDAAIPCSSPAGMPSSDNTTCTSRADFSAPTLSCEGCLGTFSLLYSADSQAAANALLGSRYSGCTDFNAQLANIWQNFYLIKKNVLGAVGEREYAARQEVQAVAQSLTQSLDPTFQATIFKLYQTAQTILTPSYGVLWGLDCSVVGEDMRLFQQASCHHTFSYSYFHRILCLVLSLALLLLLCCNTCVLFRWKRDIMEQIQGPRRERAEPYVDPLSSARLHNNDL